MASYTKTIDMVEQQVSFDGMTFDQIRQWMLDMELRHGSGLFFQEDVVCDGAYFLTLVRNKTNPKKA